jgi:hypothetical protein
VHFAGGQDKEQFKEMVNTGGQPQKIPNKVHPMPTEGVSEP